MLGTLDRGLLDRGTLDLGASFGTSTIQLSDLPLVVETVKKNVGKSTSDIVATVESVLVQKNLVKPSESVTVTETVAKKDSKPASDTVTTVESSSVKKN